MGILNVTPDSFSDGRLYFNRENAVAQGKQLEQDGADIIDIGGESTRPGSQAISEEEEMERVIPVIESLVPVLSVPISVDTYRAKVARRALEAGAQIVNDISGFRFDDDMPLAVKKSGAGVVLMHSRGSRETLHRQSPMVEPIREVMEGLAASAGRAREAGIAINAIAIDPGIGFGKTANESLRVLKDLMVFSKMEYPLLVGTSRKSFIRSMFTAVSTEANDWGTAATNMVAIMNGAHIIRVHDVRTARVVADMTDRILVA